MRITTGKGTKHYFIVGTGSVEFTAPKNPLVNLFPEYNVRFSSLDICGLTGDCIPAGCITFNPTLDSRREVVNCDFVVTHSGSSILRATDTRLLRIQLSLPASSSGNCALKDFIS